MINKEEGLGIFFGNDKFTIDELRPEFGLAFIMATFDNICEINGLDKVKAWEMLTKAVIQINDEKGPMYDPEGLQVLDER